MLNKKLDKRFFDAQLCSKSPRCSPADLGYGGRATLPANVHRSPAHDNLINVTRMEQASMKLRATALFSAPIESVGALVKKCPAHH
jgi:hypothetical protein